MRLIRLVVLTAGLCALAWAARAEVIETRAGPMRAEPVVTGLDTPWAFGFLPDGTVLITQRDGALLARLPDGTVAPISGVPEVASGGGRCPRVSAPMRRLACAASPGSLTMKG